MLLNFLLFEALKFGNNEYTITETTTFTFNMSITILPSNKQDFVFKTSKDRLLNQFPQNISASDNLVITPVDPSKETKLVISVAPAFTDCSETIYITEGYILSPFDSFALNEKRCIVFFSPNQLSLFKFDDDYQSNSFEYNYMSDSRLTEGPLYGYGLTSCQTITISIKRKGNENVPRFYMIDVNRNFYGDFETTFTNEIKINIPGSSIFVAKNIDGFNFDSAANEIFYNDGGFSALTVNTTGTRTLLYSISFIDPFKLVDNYFVEVVRNNTPIKYSYDGSYYRSSKFAYKIISILYLVDNNDLFNLKRCQTKDIIVVAPNHPVYIQASHDFDDDYDKRNLTMPDKGYFDSTFVSFTSSPQTVKLGGISRMGMEVITKEIYPYYKQYNTMFAAYLTVSTRYDFSTINSSEPETEEIYGLFAGALSYVNYSEAVFDEKDIHQVYQYGTKYIPPDNSYYRKARLGGGAIAGIVIAVIVVIAVVVAVIVFFLFFKGKKSEKSSSSSSSEKKV